jgi:transcriptional regulator with GAF, ATPase, and Fis domain
LHNRQLSRKFASAHKSERRAKTLAEAEREHILETLRETAWVIGSPYGAAAKLAVKRTTLLDRMRRLGIFPPPIDVGMGKLFKLLRKEAVQADADKKE